MTAASSAADSPGASRKISEALITGAAGLGLAVDAGDPPGAEGEGSGATLGSEEGAVSADGLGSGVVLGSGDGLGSGAGLGSVTGLGSGDGAGDSTGAGSDGAGSSPRATIGTPISPMMITQRKSDPKLWKNPVE